MYMKNKKAEKKKKNFIPTQQHLLVSEIKQDTIVMKDGTMRAVLLVSSINFALKNDDEQNAIISSYVSFLNGLDHPLQILVQSRQLQLQPYIDKLIAQEKQQNNELLRAQIADYRSFINELVSLSEIMSKRFYIVVPYDPLSNKNKSFWSRLSDVVHPATTVKVKGDRFTKRKYDLDQRVRQIESGLQSMSLTTVRLDTQSLIELLYATYNTDIALTEELPPLEKIQVENQ